MAPLVAAQTLGYAEFLEAWRAPEHEEHLAMRRWIGRRFDPEAFDREKAPTTPDVTNSVRSDQRQFGEIGAVARCVAGQ